MPAPNRPKQARPSTREPVHTLFNDLERDDSLAEFLECFPSVTREAACAVLEGSERELLRRSAA